MEEKSMAEKRSMEEKLFWKKAMWEKSRERPKSVVHIKVTVCDPVKVGNGVQSYISYRLLTKTNLPDCQEPEKVVIRRYSDFVWLRDRLFERYKGIFIPPLPEKSAVEKFRFGAEFIEMRRHGLDTFINRIVSHDAFRGSDDMRLFLLADEETMEMVRAQEIGLFNKKPADFMQIFKPVEESTPEYEKMKRYFFELEDHLAEAQKHAFRLVKRHRELGLSLSKFGKAIKLLGACEGDYLGTTFSELGTKSEAVSTKLQAEAHHLLMNFEEPLKDYLRAVQSIKATIADRATSFKQHCELAETVKLKQINLDRLMLTRSEKLGEAEKEYRELKKKSEEASIRFESIVSEMNEEMTRFQKQKTAEMGLAFHKFAKGQARLANGIAEAWRCLLPKLEACSS